MWNSVFKFFKKRLYNKKISCFFLKLLYIANIIKFYFIFWAFIEKQNNTSIYSVIFIIMALINNSAELALECSLDKLWVNYDWYYKWKCFFLHKKWTDKYTCISIRYSKLHDIKSDKYSHEIFHKIKSTKFEDDKLYCLFSTHESAPDEVKFSLIFTWKEIKEFLSKTTKKDGTKSDFLKILIDRKPYWSLSGRKNCCDITGYLCVKRLEWLKSNYLD